MERVFTIDVIENLPDRSVTEIVEDLLRGETASGRALGAASIAFKFNENYKEYSNLLLNEISDDLHKAPPRMGISSAWAIAVVLAENLKESDYSRLSSKFKKWSKEERDNLLNWLENYPEQSSILRNGKI